MSSDYGESFRQSKVASGKQFEHSCKHDCLFAFDSLVISDDAGWYRYTVQTLSSKSLCKAAITIAIRLRFDFDSTRQSGHHDSMLMKA